MLGVYQQRNQDYLGEEFLPTCVSSLPYYQQQQHADVIFWTEKRQMNKGGKFLKKLWCCVGGEV